MASAPQTACNSCQDTIQAPFPFTMAFQPVVDLSRGEIFAYEALARGPNNEPASFVLRQVTEQNRYSFDQTCRVKAISLAASLGIAATGAKLSVNFIPGASDCPEVCLRHTLSVAEQYDFPLDRLIFEITEDERLDDIGHLDRIVKEYRSRGLSIAIDDFGAGYSGLNLLADLRADIIKLDGKLVRHIDKRPRAEEIVRATVELARRLGTILVAESIETPAECAKLQMCGVNFMQGYLFARPEFEALPEVCWTGLPLRPVPLGANRGAAAGRLSRIPRIAQDLAG